MIVGEKYDVRCVNARSNKDHPLALYFVPVLGEPHIDPPSLGPDGTKWHWHLDYRFMTDKELDLFAVTDYNQPGISVSTKDQSRFTIRIERRKMLREFRKTIYTSNGHRVFERPFIGKKVVCGRCPHQGMEVTEENMCVVDGKKLYVCPGHHLVFNKNLRVIPSPEKK
jgi:hypothetical protein